MRCRLNGAEHTCKLFHILRGLPLCPVFAPVPCERRWVYEYFIPKSLSTFYSFTFFFEVFFGNCRHHRGRHLCSGQIFCCCFCRCSLCFCLCNCCWTLFSFSISKAFITTCLTFPEEIFRVVVGFLCVYFGRSWGWVEGKRKENTERKE